MVKTICSWCGNVVKVSSEKKGKSIQVTKGLCRYCVKLGETHPLAKLAMETLAIEIRQDEELRKQQ